MERARCAASFLIFFKANFFMNKENVFSGREGGNVQSLYYWLEIVFFIFEIFVFNVKTFFIVCKL